ncbi:ATP-binding protein [Pontibacter pamirensis]|uniref:ATP-binding protein n=1 Tax=Pontibacter pamirensis TaxID=2562824 RepID=UPI001F1D45AD|nr:ATP-binding protein [Pontibacter pamirensis]
MKSSLLLLCSLFLAFVQVQAQPMADSVVYLHTLPADGVVLDKGWKYLSGDNPAYANPDYNDEAWKTINPTLDIYDCQQIPKSGIVWFRLRLIINTSLERQLALIIQQSGASEIYLDGQLIHRFGVVSSNPANVKAYDPLWKPVSFPIKKDTIQVLAVRFATQPNIRYTTIFATTNHALWMQIKDVESAVSFYHQQASLFKWLHIIIIGVCFLFCVLHFAFYLFYPSQKANFYFAVFALFLVTAIVLQHIFYLEAHEVKYKFFLGNFSFVFFLVGNLFLLTAIHYLLEQKKDIFYWGLVFYVIISFFLNSGSYRWGWLAGGVLAQNLINFNILRISLLALRRKKRGSLIIVAGAILYSIGFLMFIAQGKLVNVDFFLTISTLPTVLFNINQLSIPMAASIYLGLEFAFVNDFLQQKLKEVKDLSEKSLTQEREKQQLLASQNETLEQQVTERTAELKLSLDELKSTQEQLIQREKMASLGELTAGIAHEIQNPLNFVNNFSELNQELFQEVQEEVRQLSVSPTEKANLQELISNLSQNQRKVHLHGQRADAIVKGMLEHSRASTGEKRLTDLNALVEEYLRLAYAGVRASDKDFTCTLDTCYDQSLKKMEVVPQELGRVLLNLFNNAFYAVRQKQKWGLVGYEPKVAVSTATQNGKVEIRVWDNGTGISESVKGKIFQPFFTTKPTGQGTGLGLSLSYDIITKGHGGEMRVTSKEGEWTEFTVSIPYVPVGEEQHAASIAPLPPADTLPQP